MSEKENPNKVEPTEEKTTTEAELNSPEKFIAQRKAMLQEITEKTKIALEVMREGKGRLKLEKPFKSGDTMIEELVYDFTELTGLDYTTAMDSDFNARDSFKITYRQGLALFATAAAKHTESVDSRAITENIGITDAVEGVQLATSFFAASARAGRMRISKM